MNTPHKIDPVERKSFYYQAARASLFIPLVTFGVTLVLFGSNSHISSEVTGYFALGAFVVQVISLILGIVSLFGIPRHGARLILWKAVVGIIASCGMGFVSIYLILGGGHE